MEKNELAALFQAFWKVPASDELKFSSESIPGFSSIRFYQFLAAVESNFNVKFSNVSRILTFKDLCEGLQ